MVSSRDLVQLSPQIIAASRKSVAFKNVMANMSIHLYHNHKNVCTHKYLADHGPHKSLAITVL